MTEISDQILREKELAFFGAITASVSHELNNILSIINEYSGLLSDLLIAAESGKEVDNDRLLKIVKNIEEQIKREKSIIKLLNRFAHRVDKPLLEFNLNELLADISRLSQRFASLKKVEIATTLPQEQINITSNPFTVQQTIFGCLILTLEFSNTKDNIEIALEKKGSQAVINILSTAIGNSAKTDETFDFISFLIKSLGGELAKTKMDNHRHLLRLSIPFSTLDNF